MAEGIFGSYLEGKKIGQDLAFNRNRLKLSDMALEYAPQDRAYEMEKRGREKTSFEQNRKFGDLKLMESAVTYGLSLLPTVQTPQQYNQLVHDLENRFGMDTGLPVFDEGMPPAAFSQYREQLLHSAEQYKFNLDKQLKEMDFSNEKELNRISHTNRLEEIAEQNKTRNRPELVDVWDRIKTLPESDPERQSLLDYAQGYSSYRYKPYADRSGTVSPSLRHQIREGIRKEWNELLDEDRAKFKGGLDEYMSLREEAELEALGGGNITSLSQEGAGSPAPKSSPFAGYETMPLEWVEGFVQNNYPKMSAEEKRKLSEYLYNAGPQGIKVAEAISRDLQKNNEKNKTESTSQENPEPLSQAQQQKSAYLQSIRSNAQSVNQSVSKKVMDPLRSLSQQWGTQNEDLMRRAYSR